MSEETGELNEEAIELVIQLVENQKDTIITLETAINVMKSKIETLQKTMESMTGLSQRVQNLELNSTAVQNNLDFVSFDSGAMHDLDDFRHDVVSDWRQQLQEEDFVDFDEDIPLTRSEIKERAEKFNARRQQSGMHSV